MTSLTSKDHIRCAAAEAEGLPWYALAVRGRYEKSVTRNLDERGYESFLPLYTSARRWSDRIQLLQLPLFPNYVFCRCDLRDKLRILTIPGVVSFVAIGNTPQPVNDREMTALQTVVHSGLLLKPWPFLALGQRVLIQEGPLRNVEGILAQIRDHDELVVNVTLLQRAVGVSIERSWIRPLDQCEDLAGTVKKEPTSEHSAASASRPDRRA